MLLKIPQKFLNQRIIPSLSVCFKDCSRLMSKAASSNATSEDLTILGKTYKKDAVTNVTPRILTKIGQNLHRTDYHPLNLMKRRIENHFYTTYQHTDSGRPLFSVLDNLSPVVSLYENFDSLLTPPDHPSRRLSDSYYINQEYMLRAHTSAHQEQLMKEGLDAFLLVGDVYRRDETDRTHYPVFHQLEGVRLFTKKQLYLNSEEEPANLLDLSVQRCQYNQEHHTVTCAKLIEHDLKATLVGLVQKLFGADVKYRWVDAYFPFTHPSWELEIFLNDDWLEMLGCGVIEQKILTNAGVQDKVGWAFGIGLERLAMKLYSIPDIRVFWSKDAGVVNQFKVDNPETPITYKAVSVYPSCINDISFWLPQSDVDFDSNDFYDLVGSIAGDLVESIELLDVFTHPKLGKTSHCYRITYRHLEKTFTQQEVSVLHHQIEKESVKQFSVEIR